MFGAPVLIAQGESVRHKYWQNISKINVFGAPRLLTYRLIVWLYSAETEIHRIKDDGKIKPAIALVQ